MMENSGVLRWSYWSLCASMLRFLVLSGIWGVAANEEQTREVVTSIRVRIAVSVSAFTTLA